MNSRAAVKLLLVLVLGLPVIVAVLGWVGGLLNAMQDSAASSILDAISTGCGVLWLVTVVGLVIALAVESFNAPHEE